MHFILMTFPLVESYILALSQSSYQKPVEHRPYLTHFLQSDLRYELRATAHMGPDSTGMQAHRTETVTRYLTCPAEETGKAQQHGDKYTLEGLTEVGP